MAAAALVVLVASVAEARAAVLSFAETGAETTAQVVSCTRYDPIARVYDGVVSSSSTHRSADARLGVSAGQEPIVAAMSGTSVASLGQSKSVGSIYDSDVRPPDVTRASGEIDQSANDLPGVVLSSGCCSSATKSAGEVAAVVPKAVHGNSAASTAMNYLYRLSDSETGAYLKTGISKNPGSRYTKTFMQDKEMEILQTGTRREMLNLERFIVERDPGPLNREPWAGSVSWDVP